MPESASIALDRDVTRESEKGGGAKRVECELSGYSMRVGYSFSIVEAHFSQKGLEPNLLPGPYPRLEGHAVALSNLAGTPRRGENRAHSRMVVVAADALKPTLRCVPSQSGLAAE